MSFGAILVGLFAVGFLVWVARYTLEASHRFASSPLAGPRMRRVSGLYVPLLEASFLLSLLAVAVLSRTSETGGQGLLSSWWAALLFTLVTLLALVPPVIVAVQGFTLSERQRSRGDEESAGRLTTRGFFLLLAGSMNVLVAIFVAFALSNAGS